MQEIYPWSSFNSFQTAIEIFEKDLPKTLSSDSLPTSKTYGDHIISNFRFFGFANRNNIPTDLFKQFLANKDGRESMFREILRKSYPNIFNRVQSDSDITDELLTEAFKKASPSERSRRKMANFFKNAALYADIPISATPRSRVYQGGVFDSDEDGSSSDKTAIEISPIKNGGSKEIPPIVLSLVQALPDIGTKWSGEQRAEWLKMMDAAIAFYYPEQVNKQ